jgi:general L-amino acid transport system substrate-binding protein
LGTPQVARAAQAVLFCGLLLFSGCVHAESALDRVRAAHSLTCGVIQEEEDYSHAEDHGNRAAFDLDMCKAVAVAVLGKGAAFTVKVFPAEEDGVDALRRGAVELLASASPTLRNETVEGLGFTRPTFYDGEGLMILNDAAIRSPLDLTGKDLAGKKVCFVIESRTETGLRDYAAREHISYIWYPFSEAGEMEAAFFTGNCAALAGDVSQLANTRAIDPKRAHDFTILPQILREDPLAVAYRQGDPRFAAVVNAVVDTLIEAEELGLTRANAGSASMAASPEFAVQALLGRPLGTGTLLGLDRYWARNVIEATGNYGEIFARDLGLGSPLRLERGENRLWTEGGLMYAPLLDSR